MEDNSTRIVRTKEVCKILSIGRNTLHKLRKTGDFPACIVLGERAVEWKLSDIKCWIESRPISNI